MEQQLQKLTQAILARGELLKQLQMQCTAIQASVEEMKPIRPEVKTETKPATPVVSDPLLRADVPHPSTIGRRLGPSGRRDEVTPLVDIKADVQLLVSPIQDLPQSATLPAQASSSRSLATGELDNLMPTRCSMMRSGDDTASQKSALMSDAALGSPSTAALLDVAITNPAPSLGAPRVCADTCIIAVHQLFGEMPPRADVDHAVAEVTPCTDYALVNNHPSRSLPSVDAAEGSSWNPWHHQLMHQSSGGVVVVLQPWPPPTQEHLNWFNRFDERDQHQVIMRMLEVSGTQGRSSSRQVGSRLAWSRCYAAKDIQFGVEARALMLRGVEELDDENRHLRQLLAKEGDLQFMQLQYTDEACKLSVVQKQLKELSDGIDLEENNHSEPWVSALISKSEHFKVGKQRAAQSRSRRIAGSDMQLLVDLVEIEKLEMASRPLSAPHQCVPDASDTDSKTVLSETVHRDIIPDDAFSDKYPEWIQDVLKLIIHKHQVSKISSHVILDEVTRALRSEISAKGNDDANLSYDRAEIDRMVATLIERSTENNVVSFQLFLQEKSELTFQLEHLLHVCSDVLDGKAGFISKSLEGRAVTALNKFGQNAKMMSDPMWMRRLQPTLDPL